MPLPLLKHRTPSTALSPRAREILTLAAQTAMPTGVRFPGPDAHTVERLEARLSEVPLPVIDGFELLARTFDQVPRLRRGRSFRGLSPEQRLAFMEELLRGSFAGRSLLRFVTAPLKLAHYDDPQIFAELGAEYRRPKVVAEETPRYLERALDGREFSEDEELEAEVVVVGSGAGGAALAAELAEMGLAVLIVEEGGHFQRKDFSGRPLEMMLAMYRDFGTTAAVGNCWIPVPFGRTVGGTTTINSGTCYRTPARVLRKWREERGLSEFTEEALEPHFAKVEKIIGVAPAEGRYLGGMGEVIAAGCEALGWRRHGPLRRNAPDCDGASMCVFGCPTDAKRSTNVSYVPLALRYGANLLHNARVSRVLVEGDRAVGVRARAAGGGRITVRAGAVVLSCGSLGTPALLLRQGLCNRSGQVGRNLSLHPAVGVIGLFERRIDGFRAIPQGYGIEEFHDEGLLFEGANLPPDFGAAGITAVGPRFTELMESLEHMGFFGFLIEDTSRGRVLLGPGGRPVMLYRMNRHDAAQLKRGTELLCRLFFAGGARRVFPQLPGFNEVHDERDLERLRRTPFAPSAFELTAHHPLGTCTMGLDPNRSVVAPSHETHDLRGLFVVDGSSVPSSLGVNPQVTIMTLATRAARFVARRAAEAPPR